MPMGNDLYLFFVCILHHYLVLSVCHIQQFFWAEGAGLHFNHAYQHSVLLAANPRQSMVSVLALVAFLADVDCLYIISIAISQLV